MEKHPLHLKNPELQTSPEVARAVKRKERLTGAKVANDPTDRIEAYMDRLANIFLNKDERKRERNLDMLCGKIYDALLIKRENFPESYFELQKRIARERGQAVEEIPQSVRKQMMDVAIEDQKASLDEWINYLTEEDAAYPPWFRYFVWRNIVKLSQFDKERGEFKKRTNTTVAPYPDIHRDVLGKILDLYEKVKADNSNLKDPEIRESFSKKFPALYAELTAKSLAAKVEKREETRGVWVTYRKGNQKEADRLYDSLQEKGTGWCVEGRATARSYVNQGDFHVYYTYAKDGQPTQPRLAIQMTGDQIGQIRGVLEHQDVEPILQDALDKKLQDFGKEADAYRKKSADMRTLTAIERKTQDRQPLAKDELIFLYEINGKIEGFGYGGTDPRVAELRSKRDPKEDAPIVFECQPKEIAWSQNEINKKTKAYVGPLFKDIFKKLGHLDHLYTSFPGEKMTRYNLEIGGQTKEQLEEALERAGFKISENAKFMLHSEDFETQKKKEDVDLVRLKVRDLFNDSDVHTTDEIFKKGKDIGLELCPAEVGPLIRLKITDQPMGEWFNIAMKSIAGAYRYQDVFDVRRSEDGSWLYYDFAGPALEWSPADRIVFRIPRK